MSTPIGGADQSTLMITQVEVGSLGVLPAGAGEIQEGFSAWAFQKHGIIWLLAGGIRALVGDKDGQI